MGVPSTKTAPVDALLACGCERGARGMTILCLIGAELKAETKAAGERSFDGSVKGASKVALCREFAERRAVFHEHIGLGA